MGSARASTLYHVQLGNSTWIMFIAGDGVTYAVVEFEIKTKCITAEVSMNVCGGHLA